MLNLILVGLHILAVTSQDQDSDTDTDQELVCGSYGKVVTIEAEKYVCNGMPVDAQEYATLSDEAACEAYVGERDVCLCPADYYGRTCESKRALDCSVNQVPLSCDDPGKDYNTDIPGFAACVRFDKDEVITLEFVSNCTVQNLGESIDSYYLDGALDSTEQIILENPFIYAINYPYAKSMELYTGEGVLNTIDWTLITDRNTTFKVELTSEEVLGIESWTISLDMSLISKKYYTSGRIYYQMSNSPIRT